ncbi:auxin response factor 4-like isoform X2 [Salvia miltiorrhiza]|uniref:auxin response factor 4-like isoform X2 n=1 Tax=Salvia miltiorrhiza TaxID=226208 RepID=UPI0025ACED0E|nr:auxin response factor 4-like isoform X2 [Salvia miltiorrhiza]
MEIDLNLAVCDETACGNDGECDRFSLSKCTSSAAASFFSCSAFASSSPSSSPSPSIYVELWHACAGPATILHKKGDIVVYFPQGHLEQANSSPPSFDLPPQILCRVVDVQLIANNENDEVYSQLSLNPLQQQQMIGVELEGKERENVGVEEGGKSSSHMFCKTLTASDTSTHGGFSVPRRAAEDCFPPLNYEEQRPSQELVATDLHGVEWKFRHIYRGQPRRHLLTTGWSAFVSRKNLVSGDAVLFMRGEAGEVRLGIRRAARPRNGLLDTAIKNQKYHPNVLSHVANALSSNGMFNVVYSPRASHSTFIVPYRKYLECTGSPIPVGMRFKMKNDLDDSPERRFSGVVTGVSDVDPYRWPNSKWRSVMVRWDEASDEQERICPWDVESSSSYAPLSLKRLRSSPSGSPVSGGDYVRSYSCEVLQGQEKMSKFPNWFGEIQMATPSCFYPVASEGGRRLPFAPIFKGLRVPETATLHHRLGR